MIAFLLGTLLAAAPLTPEVMEEQAALHVRQEFARTKQDVSARDKTLDAAARQLALAAMHAQPTGAPDHLSATQALSAAGGADLAPRSLVIRAHSHSHIVEYFNAEKDFGKQPASHFGVGVVTEGERANLVLLLVERRAVLQPYPRTFEKTGGQLLCGDLVAPLKQAELYLTRPDGEVSQVPLRMSREQGRSFCAQLELPIPGRYTVQVESRSSKGVDLAAVFFVDVGPRGAVPEPDNAGAVRKALLERINALRLAHRLFALKRDPTLERTAQAHCERMVSEGFVGHEAPDGTSLRDRLPGDEGLPFDKAAENLGLGSGPLAAHFDIAYTPDQFRNLLDPDFRYAGIGVVFREVDGRKQALVTEVLTAESPTALVAMEPRDEAYRTVTRLRASLKLPRLERASTLEPLALEHARRALEQDQPELVATELEARVRAALPKAQAATVEVQVVSDPLALLRSMNLQDSGYNQLAIGLVRGSSPTQGKDRYWVAIVYAYVPEK
ncbi:CAP domain-containing protein [Vitiosangium sp. GDMCC 1.1324]|uniref:CAP domain-containing protein n=1 Tax=Vitiosangium sp. (strain GDMCC 1.1324) TaxID=2138576 RepID=UPI000D34AA41|nr:CAP domain-containing protein [Vitiosangium sp. GDMCC 1.1324]PTL84384.1 hypothetical protein DAT35_04625 [Vitiosangium sp. GDMCC 1.1324]